jgi:hypothetical protein
LAALVNGYRENAMTTSKNEAPERDQRANRDRRSHGEDYPGAPDAGSDEQRYATPPSNPEESDAERPKSRRLRGGGRGDAEAAVRFGPEQDDE